MKRKHTEASISTVVPTTSKPKKPAESEAPPSVTCMCDACGKTFQSIFGYDYTQTKLMAFKHVCGNNPKVQD